MAKTSIAKIKLEREAKEEREAQRKKNLSRGNRENNQNHEPQNHEPPPGPGNNSNMYLICTFFPWMNSENSPRSDFTKQTHLGVHIGHFNFFL